MISGFKQKVEELVLAIKYTGYKYIFTNNDGYFFITDGSAPARKLRDRSQNAHNRRGNADYNIEIEEEIDEDFDDLPDDGIENDSEEGPVPEENEEETPENTEQSPEKTAETKQKNKKKNTLIKRLLRNPWTYFTVANILLLFFIIGFIISIFPPKVLPNKPRLMCGGASKIDGYFVITTDENGNPQKLWKYYDYIASVTYREFGLLKPEEDPVPFQVFSIVVSSYLMGDQHNKAKLEENYSKYLSWCPKDADGKFNPNNEYGLNCEEIPKEASSVFIVEDSDNFQKTCDVKNGCFGWKNEGYYEKFGIEDGSCLLEFQEGSQTEPLEKSKYCEIKNEIYPRDGYNIIFDEGVNKVLVEINPELKLVRHNDSILQYLLRAVDDTRGVLMVDREGIPQKTEYNNKNNLDSSACSGNIASNRPAVQNELCVGDRESTDENQANIFNQVTIKGWPVHKILMYWYDYYFASWSLSGQEACVLYKPNPKVGWLPTNWEEKTIYKPETEHKYETHYVKSYSDSTLGILSRADRVTKEVAKDKFNSYMYEKVIDYGIGTGNGVAMAAVSMINYLEQYGYRLPYSFGGANFKKTKIDGIGYWQTNYHGMLPGWGKPVVNTGPGARDLPYDQYIPFGLDCVGFSSWSIINGGIDKIAYHATLFNIPDISIKYIENEGRPIFAMPGDIMYRPSDGVVVHARVVVGVLFDYNNVFVGYQVAEAFGGKLGILLYDRGVIHGGKMTKEPVTVKAESDVEQDRIGYKYTEHPLKKVNTYAIIDHSFCYDQRGPYKNYCYKLDAKDFYRGVLFDR